MSAEPVNILDFIDYKHKRSVPTEPAMVIILPVIVTGRPPLLTAPKLPNPFLELPYDNK